MKPRKKSTPLKKAKVTPWQQAADDCSLVISEAEKLTANTAQISTILRDPRVHAQLSTEELKALGDSAETALKLLSMFTHELSHHKASFTTIYDARNKRKGSDAFSGVLFELTRLMENYQTGILPVVINVLGYGETVDERISKVETVA